MVSRQLFWFIIMMTAFIFECWGAVTARLDRSQIVINESVQLIIESNDRNNHASPDLSPVTQHFDIINQASSQNVSIVNGQQTAVKRWIIELEPKSVGSFSFPPITVGKEQTQHLRLTVLPESASTGTAVGEVFVEVETDLDEVYVQQQLRLTVRLFVGVELIEASLTDPEPENTIVKRLGDDAKYQSERGGVRYQVFERQYLMFPQQSGRLAIPPIRFQGQARDRTQSNQQLFNSFFNQGRKVRARSKPIEIAVKPPATAFSGGTWLPAKALQINDLSDPIDHYQVGQPVTRKIQIRALGLTGEQLPEIGFDNVDGVKLYPDQDVLQSGINQQDIVGVVLKSIAVIPGRSGKLTLPEIRIPWWNTQSNSQELAKLPALEIDVLPAVEQKPNIAEEGNEPLDAQVESVVSVPNVGRDVESLPEQSYWKWIAIGAIGLWLLTVFLFLVLIRQRPKIDSAAPVDAPNTNHWINKISQGCQQNDPLRVRAGLLGWAKAQFGGQYTIDDLAVRFGGGFGAELAQLDKNLYAPSIEDRQWTGENLLQQFKIVHKKVSNDKPLKSSALEPLYPSQARAEPSSP